jgi:hypothetical protein
MSAFTACMVPLMGPTPSEFFAGKEPVASMVDDHTPMELSLVISPSGKGTIKFYVEPLHPESGLPATQSSWLPSLHRLGHAVHTEQNDLHWSEVCMRHLTFDSATTQDGDEYVSATAPLQLGATQFAFGESTFHTRTVSSPDLRLEYLRCGSSIGRRCSDQVVLLSRTTCDTYGNVSYGSHRVLCG